MPNLSYTVSPFLPFTKIVSSDVNTYFSDIKTLLNTTKLDSTNVQQYGLTRDRLAQTTASAVLVNDSSGTMTAEAQLAISRGGVGQDFTSLLASNTGNAICVASNGTSYTLTSPTQATITERLNNVVSGITAGAAIAANNACCVDMHYDASGNNLYRIFNSDSTVSGRRYSHLGFATAAASVTAGVYTWVASGAGSGNFVASNSITFKINTRSYTVAFTTDNATTLQAVATAMATDPDVNGAVSDGSHTVTVTGKGALFINITNSAVTGGATQPTITVNNTVAPSGGNVAVQSFGPLAGFVGLTTGLNYYLSTAGGITAAPTDTNPVFVGQALSTTVLFINKNVGSYQLTTPSNLIRTHGTSVYETYASATADIEKYNYTSWSAGTADSQSLVAGQVGSGVVNNASYNWVDGFDTAGTRSNSYNRLYNNTSWSSATNRGTWLGCGGNVGFSGSLSIGGGENGAGGSSSAITSWNQSSWSTASATLTAGKWHSGAFVYTSTASWVGGTDATSTVYTTQDVWNGSTVSAGTAITTGGALSGSESSLGSKAIVWGYGADATTSYQWNGSWSSSITLNASVRHSATGGARNFGCISGYNSGNAMTYANGGETSGSAAQATTQKFNGSTWASDTASANSRTGASGGVF